MRLARFNTNHSSSDKRFFQGLAIPSAAAIVSGLVWVGSKYEVDANSISYLAAIVTICAGLLMVSNFRYHSFKDVDWRGRVPFVVILAVVLAFVVVATEPSLVLFIIFFLYALSGPILTIRSVNRLELKHVVGDTDEDCDDDIEQNDETRAKKQQKEDETSKSE